MPTKEQLTERMAILADEELIDQLRSGHLTEMAAEVARQELDARGTKWEAALAARSPVVAAPGVFDVWLARFLALLSRAWRFPLRAVLGLESFWAVFVFGGVAVFIVEKLLIYGLAELMVLRPTAPYVLPLAYAALVLFALVVAWLSVAFWRTGGSIKTPFWKAAVRALAILCGFIAVFGTMGAARVVQGYLVVPPSVMDVVPRP